MRHLTLPLLVGLVAMLPACTGGAATDSAYGSGSHAATSPSPSGEAKPVFMLGQFGAYARANVGYENGGELEILGGPLAVRIARVTDDAKAFVMLLHTETNTAMEGWASLEGRTARLTVPGAADCWLTLERQVKEEERLLVTAFGSSCPAPWSAITGLREGVALPRTLEWWVDQREGLYQPSYKLSDDPHHEESRIILSMSRTGGRTKPNPPAVIDEVHISRVVSEGVPAERVDLRDVLGSTPSRYELPSTACGGTRATDGTASRQIHFLADGSFELLGCGKTERYFVDDPRSCAALNGSSCASQEILDARDRTRQAP